MRFHVVGLPHTQTTLEYTSCAFTEKVRRFCIMMTNLGHEVYLYAGEQNSAPVTELITCITEEQRKEAVGDKHYTNASFNISDPHWQIFINNAIAGIKARAEQKDFLCFIGGAAHQSIANAFPHHVSVEFGIGYGATFAKYRVWESYVWMHANYSGYTNPTTVDGKFFDEVIPGYFEPEQFIYKETKQDYYLYIGRMIDRKGIHIASQVCKEMGKKLILAGAGKPPEYGEYVGVVGPEGRAELMANATALLAPTLYLEPFGNIVPEAHFSGTPTITTDWGAFVETNIHGVTGYRCRMFDEFCKALEDVKTLDPKSIRQSAMDRYSLDVIAQKYDKYFHRLSTLWNKGWYER